MASATESENTITMKQIEEAEQVYIKNTFRLKYKGVDTIRYPDQLDENDELVPYTGEPLDFEQRDGKKYIITSYFGSVYFTLDDEQRMIITDILGEEPKEGDFVVFVDPKAQLKEHLPELNEENLKLSKCTTSYIQTGLDY